MMKFCLDFFFSTSEVPKELASKIAVDTAYNYTASIDRKVNIPQHLKNITDPWVCALCRENGHFF